MSSVHVDTEARRRLLALATYDPAAPDPWLTPISDEGEAIFREWERSGGLRETLDAVGAADPDLAS
jgi:hypothetical protein